MRLKPTKFNLMRGDDETRLIKLQQRAKTGEIKPYDLSRFVRFDLHAKDEETDNIVLRLSSETGEISVQSAETGELLLHFAHSLTDNVEWERANYDLQSADEQGKIKTLVRGTIELIHDITRG